MKSYISRFFDDEGCVRIQRVVRKPSLPIIADNGVNGQPSLDMLKKLFKDISKISEPKPKEEKRRVILTSAYGGRAFLGFNNLVREEINKRKDKHSYEVEDYSIKNYNIDHIK